MTCAALLLVALGTVACADQRPFTWVHSLPHDQLTAQHTPIQKGDKLHVFVRGHEELSGEFEVSATGHYVQPLAGPIPVAGVSVQEAAQRITGHLKGAVENPRVSVSLVSLRQPVVSIVGEVNAPGHFTISPGEGLLSALARAGGLTEFADEDGIYVLRRSPELMRIRFRYDDLVGADSVSNAFELRDGDVVVVE